MTYTQSVPLKDGSHTTVRAWTLEEIGANAADFLEMLNILSATIAPAQEATMQPEAAPSTMHRLITRSLVNPEDAARLRGPDLLAVLEGIWVVNGLGDFIKGSLALRLKAREMQLAALQTLNHPGQN